MTKYVEKYRLIYRLKIDGQCCKMKIVCAKNSTNKKVNAYYKKEDTYFDL